MKIYILLITILLMNSCSDKIKSDKDLKEMAFYQLDKKNYDNAINLFLSLIHKLPNQENYVGLASAYAGCAGFNGFDYYDTISVLNESFKDKKSFYEIIKDISNQDVLLNEKESNCLKESLLIYYKIESQIRTSSAKDLNLRWASFYSYFLLHQVKDFSLFLEDRSKTKYLNKEQFYLDYISRLEKICDSILKMYLLLDNNYDKVRKLAISINFFLNELLIKNNIEIDHISDKEVFRLFIIETLKNNDKISDLINSELDLINGQYDLNFIEDNNNDYIKLFYKI